MKKLEPSLSPMHIGSMPHVDPSVAWDLTLKNFPQIPTWPQLPQRDTLENMYIQFSERFPGVMVEPGNNRIYVDRESDLDPGLEQLYMAYLENDLSFGAVSPDYAAGLYTFLDRLSAVTKEDVQRVAQTHLRPSNRTIGWFVPESQ